jgi:hypothetical protein
MLAVFRAVAWVITAGVVLAVVACALSYWLFSRDIAADITLLTGGARAPATIVTDVMLASLPSPAQRYFRFAGIVGQPIPRIVRLTQKGRIRGSLDANWMAFESDETYSTSPPSFVWRTWFPLKLMPVALGRDEYLGGKGSIVMKMLAIVPLADEHGDELAAAGLMRYLNETMWFPAALFASNVTIAPVDDRSFRVSLVDGGLTAEGVLFVDGEGRLTNFRAQRYNTATRRVETWETPVTGYRQIDGLNLPTTGSAVWKLAGGDLDYIELEVTSISHQ